MFSPEMYPGPTILGLPPIGGTGPSCNNVVIVVTVVIVVIKIIVVTVVILAIVVIVVIAVIVVIVVIVTLKSKSKSDSLTDLMTMSPIELSWTAKKIVI